MNTNNPGFDKTPSALDHETAVLGSCMSDPESLEQAAELLADSDFAVEPHRRLWRRISEMRSAGRFVDRVTIVQYLAEKNDLQRVGGIAALAQMDPLPRNAGILTSYCKHLRVCSIRRMAYQQAKKLEDLALSAADTEEIIAELQRAGETLSGQRHQSGRMLQMDQIYSRDFEGKLDSFVGLVEQTAACPIPWQEPLGGLRIGELTILAARPGAGKSSAATQIAAHVAAVHKIGVDYWSLEMKSGSILRRAVAGLSGISHYRMLHGLRITEEDKAAAYKSLSDLSGSPLRMCDSANASVEQIRSELRQARARFECPSLVVVDYLQLLSTSGGNTRNDEISRISRGLKQLTLEFPISVLALSQLSRNSEKEGNREPRLSDLRDSGSIEQDADSVVFIHKPTTDEESKVWEVQWLVKKQRNGQTGMVPLDFHRDKMRFQPRTI